MTLEPSGLSNCDPLEEASIGNYSQNPWRVCSAAENNWSFGGSAVRNWKDHNGIKTYFASNQMYKIISPSDVSLYIHFDDSSGTGLAGSLKENADIGLANLFITNDVQVGDYIFVELFSSGQASDHGFIIVGWGPIVDILDSFTNPAITSFTRSSSNPVPYVVDFCFGTEEPINANNTGWLQDPRPRPFYASAVEIGDSRLSQLNNEPLRDKLKNRNYSPFARTDLIRPNWEFYRIPDILTIAFTRIYVEA